MSDHDCLAGDNLGELVTSAVQRLGQGSTVKELPDQRKCQVAQQQKNLKKRSSKLVEETVRILYFHIKRDE